MKLLIKLLFFVVAQRLFLDSIFAQQLENGGRNGSYDNSTILNKSVGNFGNDLFGTQLLADSIQKSNVGKEDGENVVFTGPGDINLTVTNGLVFYVCSSCVGSVHICYQSRTTPTSNLNGNCLKSSQCFLQIEGEPTVAQTRGSVAFNPGSASYLKDGPTTCDKLKMSGAKTKFKNSGDIDTCDPNIENGFIQLSIKPARPGDAQTCEITAIGAKIKFPEIITTPKPQTSPTPSHLTSFPSKSSDSTSDSSIPVWAIVVIVVGSLLIILVGLIVYCWWKERSSSKTPVSSAFEAPLAVVTRTDAKESTVSTQAPPPSKQNPKIGKPEPALSQELEKKTSTKPEKKAVKEKKTTIEPTTTEEFALPEDAFEKNKLARVESAADSLEEAQKEWLKKKNERRDQKRKKKSSKKRH